MEPKSTKQYSRIQNANETSLKYVLTTIAFGTVDVHWETECEATRFKHNIQLLISVWQDPTANDAALAAALAAWDSGVRVRRRGEPSRPADALAMGESHGSNGKLKRSKSSDDDSVGDEFEYLPQGVALYFWNS